MTTPLRAPINERIQQLKAIRQRLGWSEEICAYHLGVTYSTLNRWERGLVSPRSRLALAAIDRFIARHRLMMNTGKRG